MHTYATNPTLRPRRGFTLVELIVSIAIFTIVITIAVGAYLSLIALDRKARATNDLVANLSFVVETMARSMRTGLDYEVGTGGTSFTFTDESGHENTYMLKTDGTVGLCYQTTACTNSSASTLTDPRIHISKLMFYAQGLSPTDSVQPHVTFTVSGSITPDANSDPVTFTLEGGSTQRIIDL